MIHNLITIFVMAVIAIAGFSFSSDAIYEYNMPNNFESKFTFFGGIAIIEVIFFCLMTLDWK